MVNDQRPGAQRFLVVAGCGNRGCDRLRADRALLELLNTVIVRIHHVNITAPVYGNTPRDVNECQSAVGGLKPSGHAETMRVAVETMLAKPARAEITRPDSNKSAEELAHGVFR